MSGRTSFLFVAALLAFALLPHSGHADDRPQYGSPYWLETQRSYTLACMRIVGDAPGCQEDGCYRPTACEQVFRSETGPEHILTKLRMRIVTGASYGVTGYHYNVLVDGVRETGGWCPRQCWFEESIDPRLGLEPREVNVHIVPSGERIQVMEMDTCFVRAYNGDQQYRNRCVQS